MIRLFQTTDNGTDLHHHYVYFDDDNLLLVQAGGFPTTVKNDHPHPVIINIPQQEIIDEAGLQETLMNGPELPERITLDMLTIEDFENHGHEFSREIPYSESTEVVVPERKDHAIVRDGRSEFDAAYQRERRSSDQGDLAEQFFIGNQWLDDNANPVSLNQGLNQGDRTFGTGVYPGYDINQGPGSASLVSGRRSQLTVNLVQPYLNLLLGHHRQNRTDLKVVPVERSDELIADVLTAIIKIELTNNNYEFEENQVVEDQLIPGRGNLYCYIDYDDNVFGDIKVERMPWRQVHFGEHEKYTAADADVVMASVYYTKGEAFAEWGSDIENLSGDLNALEEQFERRLKEDNVRSDGISEDFDPTNYYDATEKSFRVIWLWRKERAKIFSIVNQESNFVSTADTRFADMDQLEQVGFKQVERKKAYIRRQVFIGGSVLLEDEIEEVDMKPIIPVYYDKRGDLYWGKVSLSFDLQRFYNKLLSKVADFVNKFVTSTHFYDDDTFDHDTSIRTEQQISEELGQPGAFVKVKNVNENRPIPMLNGILPAQVFALLGEIKELMLTVYNLNPAFFGETRAESGIKVLQDKQQARMGNEKFSDNLGLSKRYLGKLMIKNIAVVYTGDRVVRLLNNNSVEGLEFALGETGQREVMDGSRNFTPQELEEIEKRFNEADLTKYDVTVAQSPYTPTTMISNYMMMAELMQSGQLPIPPEALIEVNPFIDHKTKKKVLQQIEAARSFELQQAQAEQQAQQTRTETAGKMDIANTIIKSQLDGTKGPVQQ
jgi:hypothetical protein